MDVAQILGPKGPVASRLSNYEVRDEQLRLAEAVDGVMRNGGRLVAEAGTGVGKSFAYLVPAVAAAAERGERVVIATHTIALQEQLLDKDVPFLSGILPAEFSVVLAKGRGNFLCLRRMGMAKAGGRDLFDGDDLEHQLERIVRWAAEETHDGSRQELDFTPEVRVWSKVNAEAGNCLGRRCTHYDRCFYQAGRRRLQNANLIVANHHFLFADMALRRVGWNLLPDFQHLILDEAHGLEDVAAEYLGMRVSRRMVLYVLGVLVGRGGQGLLRAIGADEALVDLTGVVRGECERFFEGVELWCREGRPPNHRITRPEMFPTDLADHLERLGNAVEALSEEQEEPERRIEVAARAARCLDLADTLRALIHMRNEDHVHWVEREGAEDRNLALVSAPVAVSGHLGEFLWERLKSVTLTSATLSTAKSGGFAHVAGRLGLGEIEELQLGSPFRYQEQARLVVDARLPDPREVEPFETALADAVVEHVRATGGHAFVLFTSYQSLDRCHTAVAAALRNDGFLLLKQGEGLPRGRMIEEFRAAPSAVLFGTDSFWQGVDVPGDALQNVIITRLPFSVPTHPLQEARTQAIRDRGGDAFGEYSLPQAILKFKQGFGRLIRSRRDSGRVVVLDKRIVAMRYGRRFIDALPELPVEVLEAQR